MSSRSMSFPDELMHLIRTDEPLGPLVWLGIGGPARYFAEPVEQEDVQKLIQAANEADLPVRILGGGSNLLVRESGFDGLVISMSGSATSGLEIDGTRMTVGAGAKLSHAVIKSVGAGLGGIEHLVGIPGTVGGAVMGNASSDGRDIGSAVESVTVLERSGEQRVLTQQEAGFSHRKSSLVGLAILSVTFQLESRDVTALTKRMQKLWIGRNASRPNDEPRMAMPFVEPDQMSVNDLLQQVGMAGVCEGEVSLDTQNPQFLVARSGATSEQCMKLIGRVREQVLLQTGIDLQLNLQIW
ncbi:MAG: UDP-N-acetylmuramate dehydrogenase [Rubripirellula sp.]|nr:UDP-N-acetylmuramate dehydrogenase [Rubripirellula sp.]